ncbi:hypothetical protein GWI33_000132 [Rhynchophorus ferrugineus]|uniref:Uncharacterized protein n=1 Tax=Rhynchophorus ferrugineus TaxID=354439 RepID=A0A834IX68_RHYFE|nr:hypothetical protein GWI33_000132 [Rhynchophorus ferrugineus]
MRSTVTIRMCRGKIVDPTLKRMVFTGPLRAEQSEDGLRHPASRRPLYADKPVLIAQGTRSYGQNGPENKRNRGYMFGFRTANCRSTFTFYFLL